MSYDISAIPEIVEGQTTLGFIDSIASDLGLAAVLQALAPLLGPFDAELRSVVERAKTSLLSLQPAFAF